MGQFYYAIILAEKNISNHEIIRLWMNPSNYMNGLKLTEHSYIDNNFMNAFEYLICPENMFYKSRIVWAGDYAEPEENINKNLYHCVVKNGTYRTPNVCDMSEYRYIINHTKKLYVDKSKNKFIHPLPLLVSEGNGMASGDYYGHNNELCGTWARDIISIDKIIPDNYLELICDFSE